MWMRKHTRKCANTHICEHTCTHTRELSMSLPPDFSVDRSFASLSFHRNLRSSMRAYSTACVCSRWGNKRASVSAGATGRGPSTHLPRVRAKAPWGSATSSCRLWGHKGEILLHIKLIREQPAFTWATRKVTQSDAKSYMLCMFKWPWNEPSTEVHLKRHSIRSEV